MQAFGENLFRVTLTSLNFLLVGWELFHIKIPTAQIGLVISDIISNVQVLKDVDQSGLL